MVATPIGNPEDLSPRAKRVLESCALILAEDTRRSLRLCRELNIHVQHITSFHDHNEQEKEEEMLDLLTSGKNIALISDAGTPLMADPGFRLVRACHNRGIAVHPIPGPSAPVTALSAAGIPPLPYTFLGFLPRDHAGQNKLFSTFASIPSTLVFFERKDRLADSLRLAGKILGPRQCAVCRELTKEHEEFILFRLEDTKSIPGNLLGELTVLIGPPEAIERTDTSLVKSLLAREALNGDKPKVIARRVQEQVSGWNAKELYALLTTRG